MGHTLKTIPENWDDVRSCQCEACCALTEIYHRCYREQEFLFVVDCRMHGAGFTIADVRKLFAEPAATKTGFKDQASSVLSALHEQYHCDAFVSSWPLKPESKPDYAWRREIFSRSLLPV